MISCIVLDIRLNLVLYDVVPSCSQKFPGAAYAPPVFASLHSLLLSFVSSLSFSLNWTTLLQNQFATCIIRCSLVLCTAPPGAVLIKYKFDDGSV